MSDIDGPNKHEHIDLASSSLSLNYSEIKVPVNGGLTMEIGRSMTTAYIDRPGTTYFWYLTAGVVVDNRGESGYSAADSRYNPTYIGADGSRQNFVPTTGGYTSMNNWKAVTNSSGYILTSPQGITYTFAHVYSDSSHYYFLTKVADRTGNFITYQYSGQELISATSSDGRKITVSYAPMKVEPHETVNVPTSITFNGVVVRRYAYGLEGWTDQEGYPVKVPVLTQVTLPDGRQWRYGYTVTNFAPIDGKCRDAVGGHITAALLTSVINPNGEKTVYSYIAATNPQFYALCYRIPGIVGKTNTAPNGKTSTWSFKTLSVNRNDKTVRVINPEYAVDYTVGIPANDWNWENGLLTNKTIYATPAAKTPLETIHNTWIYTTALAPQAQNVTLIDYSFGRLNYNITYTDKAAYHPLLYARKITLGDDTYTNLYSNWDTYGMPREIDQTGDNDKTRKIILSYYTDATNHIIDKLATLTADGIAVTNKKYNTNGQLIQDAHYGQTTTYTYDTSGNLASKADH